MGPDAMIFIFWILSFKPAFSLSSFPFIERLFSFSSLSAVRVASSAYLRLLIFLPAIFLHRLESAVFDLQAELWSLSFKPYDDFPSETLWRSSAKCCWGGEQWAERHSGLWREAFLCGLGIELPMSPPDCKPRGLFYQLIYFFSWKTMAWLPTVLCL